MTPADLRALMAKAEWRPGMSTADVIERARAEGVLEGWRAWLPGLLDQLAITPWEPRIGDLVTPSESYLSLYGEWRGLPLYVVGIAKERERDGLNITVSEQWPVERRSDGFTDGFYIGRSDYRDDLVPLAGTPDPDHGKIGPGHVCKHQVRWPHPCQPCDDAAWEARPSTQAEAEARGLV